MLHLQCPAMRLSPNPCCPRPSVNAQECCEGVTLPEIATPQQVRSAAEMSEGPALLGCLVALAALAAFCVVRHAPTLARAHRPAVVVVTPPPPAALPTQLDSPRPPSPLTTLRVQAELDRLLASGRVEFERGNARLQANASPLLDAIAAQLATAPELEVEVEAHTDAQGDAAADRQLSQLRAQTVKAYLTSKGIAPERIHTLGSGSARPLVRARTAEANQLNRRIEFRVFLPGSR